MRPVLSTRSLPSHNRVKPTSPFPTHKHEKSRVSVYILTFIIIRLGCSSTNMYPVLGAASRRACLNPDEFPPLPSYVLYKYVSFNLDHVANASSCPTQSWPQTLSVCKGRRSVWLELRIFATICISFWELRHVRFVACFEAATKCMERKTNRVFFSLLLWLDCGFVGRYVVHNWVNGTMGTNDVGAWWIKFGIWICQW